MSQTLAAAFIMIAVSGCSGDDPSGKQMSGPVGGAGSNSAGSGASGGLIGSSGGSGPAAAGASNGGSSGGSTSASTAGSAGSSAGSGSGTTGGSAGTASGGSAPGGAGGAAGSLSSGGASSAGGASTTLSYSTDRATFGGAVRCTGFDVCESFESTAAGALPSGFTLEGYGTRKVGVSTDRAMRGTHSLKIEVSAQSAVTAWLTRANLGPLAQRSFGRAFFRIDGPAPTEFVHFDLFQGSGPYQGHTNAVRYASTGTGVGTSSSNWSFIYNVQPSGNGAGSEFGSEGNRSAHPRVDDWMCLEWAFDAGKQTAQYYLDGAAIDYLNIDTERAEIPVFDSFSVGFGKYQNTGAFVVSVDELAFDGDRIGCNN